MEGAGDIADFIIPYTAGVFTAVLGQAAFASIILPAASISSALAAISLTIMLLQFRRGFNTPMIRGLIAIAGLSTGMMCGLTGIMNSWCDIDKPGMLTEAARSFCMRLEAAISSIPFDSGEAPGIIKALLTGNRDSLTAEISGAFRSSGAAHILALSGLHLGIIYGVLSKILCIAGNSQAARLIRSALTIAACGFYTLATGAGASITRAYLFILLHEVGKLTGRSHSIGTVLAAALLIQLTADPTSAAGAGFQLSYAAMAGIAFIYPQLTGMWPKEATGFPVWIWRSAAMSISCQLTTGPIAYLYFGTFPHYFLLTNMIALPLTGVIIPASLAVVALHMLGICPDVLIKSLEGIIVILTDALEIISTM